MERTDEKAVVTFQDTESISDSAPFAIVFSTEILTLSLDALNAVSTRPLIKPTTSEVSAILPGFPGL